MREKFVRPARLPKAAYNKTLVEVLEPYIRKGMISTKKKDKKIIPRVFKSSFGGYYTLVADKFTQEELKKAFEEQKKKII